MNVRSVVQATIGIALLSLSLSQPALAQGSFGSIGGTAMDSSGAVLPGVTVTLSNPGTIGGNQVTVTDARGTYQFPRLVPGRYSVKGELTGFRAISLEEITVNAQATARADLTLRIDDLQETVTVSGAAPLLDTTAVLKQTVMTREVLDTLPGTNDVWSIGRLVPAVIQNNIDVGGTGGFQQSTTSVHGSRGGSETNYLIDGMNIGSVSGDGGIQMYYDPFMFEQLNYQTGGVSAETSRGGFVYNMVTQTGTNRLRGSFMYNGSNESLQANNISPALRQDLLAAVPARALEANPNLQPGSKIISMFDTGFSLSGPVVHDKLWFVGTGKLVRLDQLRVGSYNPDGTQFVDDNKMVTFSAKASWAVNPSSQLHYTYLYSNKQRFHWAGNSLTDFWESAATRKQELEPHLNQVRWTRTFSSRIVLDISGSNIKNYQPRREADDVAPGAIAGYDSLRRAHLTANPIYEVTRDRRTVAHATLGYFAGRHDLKAGFQWDRGSNYAESWSTSHFPSGIRAVFRNGVPDSVNTYNTPTTTIGYTREIAMFLQDKWTPTRKLTLNLGVRVEQLVGWRPATCQPETIFIAARCFDALEDVPNWLDATPRLGLIYDLSGDGRMAVKVGASRYNIGTATGHSGRVNPIRITNDTRSWTDANGDRIPQLSELGPSTGFNLGTTSRYNPDLKRPYAMEYFVEFDRQLARNTVFAAGFFYRTNERLIGNRNMAVPTESYTPIQVTERTSGREVTVYNLAPALRGKFDVLWDNFSELDTVYKGVDLSVTKRLADRWMLMGSASFGRNEGDIFPTSDLNNPNFQNRHGAVGMDVPVVVKASGIYEFGYGVMISGNLQHYAGAPENTTVQVSRNTVTLTQVSQSILIEPRGTIRLPSLTLVDLNVRKILRVDQRSIEPVFEIHNLFNVATVQSRNTTLGPAYGRANNISRGRLLKFGVNVKF
ncbi:MAG TPA: TonB-dependent receptor [Gemmatimonadaceae bacterium]|nr:TonB-dependent receptor [Gemmatimonadaceae bacterium]